MNPVTVLAGIAAIAYGIYTSWARKNRPGDFKKVEAMQKAWGERGGFILHLVAYTVVPIVVGIFLLFKGVRGGAIF